MNGLVMTERTQPLSGLPAGTLEEFAVHALTERLALLRDIAGRRSLITVCFGGEEKFIITTLLAVDAQRSELVFDAASEPAAMPSLLSAGDISAATSLDAIRILFSSGQGTACVWNGRAAFRATLPIVMFRIQRREAFRVPAPVAQPLVCRCRRPDSAAELRLRVADLSGTGMSLLVDDGAVALEPDMLLEECHLELPGAGTVRGSARVVRVDADPVPARPGRRRVACRFVGLPGTTQTLLHRYVIERQRQRH